MRGSVSMPVLPSQFVSPSPSALCPYVHSPCLWLYSCPANRFISTIFKNAWTIFVFLFLACFSLYDRLSVHPHYSKWPNFVPFLWLSSIPLYTWITVSCIPHWLIGWMSRWMVLEKSGSRSRFWLGPQHLHLSHSSLALSRLCNLSGLSFCHLRNGANPNSTSLRRTMGSHPWDGKG